VRQKRCIHYACNEWGQKREARVVARRAFRRSRCALTQRERFVIQLDCFLVGRLRIPPARRAKLFSLPGLSCRSRIDDGGAVRKAAVQESKPAAQGRIRRNREQMAGKDDEAKGER
jgi:hypothetical protein